jgi:hypothetical protein
MHLQQKGPRVGWWNDYSSNASFLKERVQQATLYKQST